MDSTEVGRDITFGIQSHRSSEKELCSLEKQGRVLGKSVIAERGLENGGCKVFDELPKWSFDRTLLVTVSNIIYPITESVLHQVFDSFGKVEMIHILPVKDDFQALLRYEYTWDARLVVSELQGRNIYDGCCGLDVQLISKDFLDKCESYCAMCRDSWSAIELRFIFIDLMSESLHSHEQVIKDKLTPISCIKGEEVSVKEEVCVVEKLSMLEEMLVVNKINTTSCLSPLKKPECLLSSDTIVTCEEASEILKEAEAELENHVFMKMPEQCVYSRVLEIAEKIEQDTVPEFDKMLDKEFKRISVKLGGDYEKVTTSFKESEAYHKDNDGLFPHLFDPGGYIFSRPGLDSKSMISTVDDFVISLNLSWMREPNMLEFDALGYMVVILTIFENGVKLIACRKGLVFYLDLAACVKEVCDVYNTSLMIFNVSRSLEILFSRILSVVMLFSGVNCKYKRQLDVISLRTRIILRMGQYQNNLIVCLLKIVFRPSFTSGDTKRNEVIKNNVVFDIIGSIQVSGPIGAKDDFWSRSIGVSIDYKNVSGLVSFDYDTNGRFVSESEVTDPVVITRFGRVKDEKIGDGLEHSEVEKKVKRIDFEKQGRLSDIFDHLLGDSKKIIPFLQDYTFWPWRNCDRVSKFSRSRLWILPKASNRSYNSLFIVFMIHIPSSNKEVQGVIDSMGDLIWNRLHQFSKVDWNKLINFTREDDEAGSHCSFCGCVKGYMGFFGECDKYDELMGRTIVSSFNQDGYVFIEMGFDDWGERNIINQHPEPLYISMAALISDLTIELNINGEVDDGQGLKDEPNEKIIKLYDCTMTISPRFKDHMWLFPSEQAKIYIHLSFPVAKVRSCRKSGTNFPILKLENEVLKIGKSRVRYNFDPGGLEGMLDHKIEFLMNNLLFSTTDFECLSEVSVVTVEYFENNNICYFLMSICISLLLVHLIMRVRSCCEQIFQPVKEITLALHLNPKVSCWLDSCVMEYFGNIVNHIEHIMDDLELYGNMRCNYHGTLTILKICSFCTLSGISTDQKERKHFDNIMDCGFGYVIVAGADHAYLLMMVFSNKIIELCMCMGITWMSRRALSADLIVYPRGRGCFQRGRNVMTRPKPSQIKKGVDREIMQFTRILGFYDEY